MPDHLYVSVSGDDPHLATYRIDASGGLRATSRASLPGNPGALAASPDGRSLFADVTVNGDHQAHSFRIDPATGDLRHFGTAEIGPYPCYLATDKTGRFLLAAYYSDGMATVHRIGDDGAVTDPRVQVFETAPKAHCILTDATNRFAFVPHVGDENAIWQFRFDEATGTLTPNDPPKASPEPGQGPRHMCFHPNGLFAFSNGEQGSSVTAWACDAEAGTLAPLQTLSTLPADWDGEGNSCSQIRITPDGRFLYSCNRGHDSLAAYRIQADTGMLTALGQFGTDPTPRPLAISPDGDNLYVAGAGSRLQAWIIADDGTLLHPVYHETGPVSWVLEVQAG